MFEVRLDRSYYSKSQIIFDHLKEQFKIPKDSYTPWKGMTDGFPYYVSQNFGYTDILFVDEVEAKKFEEWIKTL
jgi:hypothetical protein